MNAILLGAASLGALAAMFTGNPSDQDARIRLELAKAERAAVEQTIEDRGEMKRMTIIDPKSGETTNVSVISFAD
ncbi:MAG: hypothetical protein EON61_14235 [Alphaproteobacteria bacterium]|jgi:hypothetical protein|nr:MAG: hypothetical protein EON61_14235 [Alphaproteobacteria bacterium]